MSEINRWNATFDLKVIQPLRICEGCEVTVRKKPQHPTHISMLKIYDFSLQSKKSKAVNKKTGLLCGDIIKWHIQFYVHPWSKFYMLIYYVMTDNELYLDTQEPDSNVSNSWHGAQHKVSDNSHHHDIVQGKYLGHRNVTTVQCDFSHYILVK